MIVGFIGFQRVGKTTASNYLIEKYGFVRHNMKDALVAEIKQNFPDLLREIADWYNSNLLASATLGMKFLSTDDLFDVKPPLMRALLQNYGTEVRRRDNDNYWVDQWQKKAMEINNDIVVDDVRFLNEAEAVREKGGKIIRLVRSDVPTGGEHRSETENLAIDADYTISCEGGDEAHLYAELDRIYEDIVRGL